jgi:thioredoxin-related protein
MKILFVLFLSQLIYIPNWFSDFQQARQIAVAENKFILLNFSGSDWCGPCIRLKKTIFETESFNNIAKDKLVLVNADFPRLKKNALPAEQQKKNDALADQYNPKGLFPLTLLLNADGKVVKTWEGLPAGTAEDFVNQILSVTDASK